MATLQLQGSRAIPTMQDVYDPEVAPLRSHLNPLRNLGMQRLVALLEMSMRGYYADLTWLYAHVERREHVMKALVERRQSALGQCVWRVEVKESAAKDKSMAGMAQEQQEFLHEVYGNIDNLVDAWKWLGMATFRKFSHLEKHYDSAGMVKHLEPVPQWFWCRNFPSLLWDFNETAMNTNRGQTIAPEHFVVREVEAPIDELACFDWVRKSLAIRDWSTFASTFGVPNIFLECTDRNNMPSPNEVEAWRGRLNQYISNGRGVLPPGMKATLFSAGSSEGTPFPGFTEYIDKMLVLAGTGGKLTMLSDATGIGSGATVAHQDAFEEIAANEGMEIAQILNRSISQPLLAEVWPDQPQLVEFVIARKDKIDQKQGADILSSLKAAGYTVGEEEAEKLVGMDLTAVAEPTMDAAVGPPQEADDEETDDEDAFALNRTYERDPKGTRTGGRFASHHGMVPATRHVPTKSWRHKDGSTVPDHIAKLGIPPGWTDVHVNPDPDADLQAIGVDAKGRTQRIYSDKAEMRAAAVKFARNQSLMKEESSIARQIRSDMRSEGKRGEAAKVMGLIYTTGIRPGSDADTGADKQAYGATTLLGKHVTQQGGAVVLRFTGKKGVDLTIPVADKSIAGMLVERSKLAGKEGRLFSVSAQELREYSRGLGKGGFKPKDFRTLKGTMEALRIIKTMEKPASKTEYVNAVKRVATHVSQVLGNTPTIALKAYINPAVWADLKPA